MYGNQNIHMNQINGRIKRSISMNKVFELMFIKYHFLFCHIIFDFKLSKFIVSFVDVHKNTLILK